MSVTMFLQSRAHVAGIDLADDLTQHIVAILPCTLVRIVHGELVTQLVVGHGRSIDVTRQCPIGGNQTTDGIVAVSDHTAHSINHFGGFIQHIFVLGATLPQWVDDDESTSA